MKILVNHLGYEKKGAKHAVLQGKRGEKPSSFRIVDTERGKRAYAGKVKQAGPVRSWKDWHFWTADFDALTREGTYRLEVPARAGTVTSFPFRIRRHALERDALSDVIFYFKGQRCSGLLDKADRSLRLDGKGKERVDARGGWYDASADYGKHLTHLSFATYFNPQQIPLTAWGLFKAHAALVKRGDANFRQYRRRLLDEALFGADYLVRIKSPKGSFYRTVSGAGLGKLPKDRIISGRRSSGFALATKKKKDCYAFRKRSYAAEQQAYEVGYREGGGLCIAALAMAAACGEACDFSRSQYRRSAEHAFNFLEKNNLRFTNDGRENIVDDYCALAAATELFKATGKQAHKSAADARAAKLVSRLTAAGYWRADDGDRPFFHPSDAGLPAVSLLYYCDIAKGAAKRRALEAVKRSVEHEIEVTREVNNPFGLARQLVQGVTGERRTSFFFPQDAETAPWWQGENARLASLAVAARLAAAHLGGGERKQVLAYATDQMNWILGLNPYDACMLEGTGHNNPPYMFFDSWEYANAPGGICNGITAGLKDERDIDFLVPTAQTGVDNDWRWGEQWIPHAAWFLLAASLGGG